MGTTNKKLPKNAWASSPRKGDSLEVSNLVYTFEIVKKEDDAPHDLLDFDDNDSDF